MPMNYMNFRIDLDEAPVFQHENKDGTISRVSAKRSNSLIYRAKSEVGSVYALTAPEALEMAYSAIDTFLNNKLLNFS